jgi:solute carrier family 25 (mitochondrial phosphate transporter), member 23/24/25/41
MSALQFWSYERMKDAYVEYKGSGINPLERLVAGGIAGIIAMIATYPLDVVRGRLTTQDAGAVRVKYKGIGDALVRIAREEGVFKGLWRGSYISVIGVFPYLGTQFSTYGTLQELAAARYGVKERDLPGWVVLVNGGLAGAVGQTVAYPFDLLRRRIQVATFAATSHGSSEAIAYQSGMVYAFRHILQNEGVPGLYRGLLANYTKIFPSTAVNFWVYEYLKNAFHISSQRRGGGGG